MEVQIRFLDSYNKMKKFLPHIIASFAIMFPLFLFAGPSGYTIDNPLKSNDVKGILMDVMKLVATVGAIIVVFFIIYSGYKFVTARGDPGKIEEAKKTFYATVIGGAILLGADIIANIVVNTVKTTTGTTF